MRFTSGSANLKYRHGQSHSKLNSVWHRMKQRCLNPSCGDYKYYGARGITVCQRWRDSFEAFVSDMGQPLPGFTLDRIDNDGSYSPENCRWATRKEQIRNSSVPTLITAHGQSLNMSEWARHHGVSDSAVIQRIKRGMTPLQAVTVPFRKPCA